MKKIFLYSIIVCFFLNSCLVPDNITPEPITFEKLSDIPQLIPYQTVSFGGNKYPGNIYDYKMYFGDTEIHVSKVKSDSIYAFVPFDIQVGMKDVRLLYKENEFDIGKVEIIDWNTISPHNISYFETNDEEYPYHIIDSLNNSIIPHVSNGKVDKIYISTPEGKSGILELNPSGLPSIYYSEEETVIFDGYDLEKFTVNIARFSTGNIGNAVYEFGIPLNPSDIKALISAHNGTLQNARSQGIAGDIFGYIGNVFNITSCIVGVVVGVAVPPTLLAGGVLLLSCGSAAYDIIKLIDPDKDHQEGSMVQSVHGITSSLVSCLGLTIKPKNAKELYDGIYGCYSLFLEAGKGIDYMYTDFINSEAKRDVEKVKAILSTGYGDVKVTLDWNTSADIDLWIIDPNGESISYRKPNSSSEGLLDLDDTDGYGPENIFWPTDKAPFGKYTVKVHYYGPEDGPISSYRIMIFNFGKTKTFEGSISYNQSVVVAEFEATSDWNNNLYRLAGPTIEFVDRSSLPQK